MKLARSADKRLRIRSINIFFYSVISATGSARCRP